MTELDIVPRRTWSDLKPPGHALTTPVKHVFIHCTVVPDVRLTPAELEGVKAGDVDAIWRSLAADLGAMRAVDRAHDSEAQDYGGFGYNFAGFDDGTCWEGRGWHRVGAHVKGWNSKSLGYAWMIHGDRRRPTDLAWATFATWMVVGLEQGFIRPDFDLQPHRAKRTDKSCPGDEVTDRELEDLERFVKKG